MQEGKLTQSEAKALVAKYGCQRLAAKAAGVAKSTLWEALRRDELGVVEAKISGKESEVVALRRELALERAKLSALCQARGNVTLVKNAGNTIKYGVISDPHVGSMYFNETAFDAMFRYYKELGIKDVLCAGDILSGHKVYKGHEYEVSELGFGNQLKKLVSLDTHGAVVKFITGNHDLSFKALAGVRVGEEIASSSKSWQFLGDEQADVEFTTTKGPYRVRLIHPGGGTAYAISYKVQKIVDSLGGGNKPNMIISGHFHKAEFIPSYRNVAICQPGTFENQTPFMARMGLAAHVGGWVVEVTVGETYNIIKTEFVPFYA